MAASTNAWENDENLRTQLADYVQQGMQRNEVLDYMNRDFSCYKWSFITLDRRMRYFAIFYIDKNVSVTQVREAVKVEMEEPGQLLGYRAMQQKIRQKYNLKVPRDRIYDLMYDIDSDRLEERRPWLKKKRANAGFTTKGPNWIFSVDGHDKLMGYQNSTFPLAIYGCIDTASRKIMWLRVWTTNSNPKIIGRWYLEYLLETHRIPAYLRMDKGTETGVMATMHAYLRRSHTDISDPVDTVCYGPSTSNQVSISLFVVLWPRKCRTLSQQGLSKITVYFSRNLH